MAPERHLIGVDVGTGSARAGVFDAAGQLRAAASRPIAIWHDEGGVVEQSSADIWAAACAAVRKAVARAGIGGDSVAGIGFDATCSMVVLGAGGVSLPVGPSGDPQRDVIVWMDHRAIDQADRINAGGHAVLRHVGGRISPEMQTPRLLWLAEHRPQVFGQAWQFFDLVDFLTWKATGALDRSACTVTCKWTYLAHEGRWDAGYFRAIGLGVLADEGFRRIGARIVSPGTALAAGLTAEAAGQLGLPAGTPVGAGLIDAHGGGLGTVGLEGNPTGNVAYVFGTSSCTMTSTRDPVFVPGVWRRGVGAAGAAAAGRRRGPAAGRDRLPRAGAAGRRDPGRGGRRRSPRCSQGDGGDDAGRGQPPARPGNGRAARGAPRRLPGAAVAGPRDPRLLKSPLRESLAWPMSGSGTPLPNEGLFSWKANHA